MRCLYTIGVFSHSFWKTSCMIPKLVQRPSLFFTLKSYFTKSEFIVMLICCQIKNGLAFLLIIHVDWSHNLYEYLRCHCTWNWVIWWRTDTSDSPLNYPSVIFSFILPSPHIAFWRRAWKPTPVFLPGKSPWTEEPGRLQSIGLQRVGYDWVNTHTQYYSALSHMLFDV